MIRLDMPQGSDEWLKARLGIPTASQFHRLVTPKTGKLSAASDGYLHELIAEWALGVSLDETLTAFMQRGTDLEESAVSLYEFTKDVVTDPVGFCLTDDRTAGCSPDRLVGDDGGLEIKCPGAAQHVANILEMTTKYTAQVQGALWVTGRDWWDLLSYHPTMPPAMVRIRRDEAFIKLLAGAVAEFTERLEQAKATMIAKGYRGAA